MRAQRRGVKAPKLFGRPMRKTRGKGFVLRYAGWTFSVIGIGVHQWMYSIAAPDGTGGHLLGDASLGSADSAAAEIERLISNLAIAVVTSNSAATSMYDKSPEFRQWSIPKLRRAAGKTRARRA